MDGIAQAYYERGAAVAHYRSKHFNADCKESIRKFACYSVYSQCLPSIEANYVGVCR